MYKISFHTPVGKTSPVKKFLDSCQSSLRAKIVRQLKYVEEYGLNPVIPNIKKIAKTPHPNYLRIPIRKRSKSSPRFQKEKTRNSNKRN